MGIHVRLRSAFLVLTFLAIAVALVGPARAEPPSWPQFRGPGGLSSAPDQRIPDEFGPDRNVRWQREVPAGHSSPVIWGDRLFSTGYQGIGDRVLVGSVRGTMFVLGTGDGLEIVARNDFGEGIFATPAVVEDTMYLRTARHLWAVGATDDSLPSSPDTIGTGE